MIGSNDFQGEIAKIAYDLYLQRGMIDGYDFDDWLQAEKIVMAQHKTTRKSKTEIVSTIKRKGHILKKEQVS
jgi:hypothetical protein